MAYSPPFTKLFNKEVAIRKRISNIYNKREEDFPSLKEYNDYLEEVEDMTFKLIEGVDVLAIESRIEEYQKENAEQIMNSRAQKAEEMARAFREQEKPTTLNHAADMDMEQSSQTGGAQYAPATAPGMFMQPRPVAAPSGQPGYRGSEMMLQDEESYRYHEEKGARAGGWTPDVCKKRAMEEAFNSLWIC